MLPKIAMGFFFQILLLFSLAIMLIYLEIICHKYLLLDKKTPACISHINTPQLVNYRETPESPAASNCHCLMVADRYKNKKQPSL